MHFYLKDIPSRDQLREEAEHELTALILGPRPDDPEERRLWKLRHYGLLYGMSHDQFIRLMERARMEALRQRSQRRRRNIHLTILCLLTFALVLAVWHLGSTP